VCLCVCVYIYIYIIIYSHIRIKLYNIICIIIYIARTVCTPINTIGNVRNGDIGRRPYIYEHYEGKEPNEAH